MVSLLQHADPWQTLAPRLYTEQNQQRLAARFETMSSPAHQYNFALQQYLLLQEQHQELSAHLDQIRPSQPSHYHISPYSTQSSQSPSVSPTRSSSMSSDSSTTSTASSSKRRGCRTRTFSPISSSQHVEFAFTRSDTLDTIPDEETLYEISAEERRLFDVNESMKRALTELLNCDAVRSDGNMRMWVQMRLMEVEKELRSGRRRKNSAES